MQKLQRLMALAPLLIYFLLTTGIADATSLTIDEGLHIASGYTILRTGDYRLVEEHPPLVKLWMALPLLPLRGLSDPTALPAWEEAAKPTTESLPLLHMAQQLLYPYRPTERWIFPARTMEALLGVLLLAGITRWACDLWSVRSAMMVALLAALDPNLLAHGAVAGTDLGATALIFLALFVAQRFLKQPSRRRAALTGVMLGLALTAKLTALLLGPILAIAGVLRLFRTKGMRNRRRLLKLAFLVVGIALLTFWGIYGFQFGAVPGITLPLPAAAHATPILRLAEHSAGGHQAYLLGENSMHGWWWYFPVAFALKTPLPTLLLLVWTLLGALTRTKNRESKIQNLTLWLFPALYVASSLLSPLNIGYRHLLPVLPFLYIGIGQVGSKKVEGRSKKSEIRSEKLEIRSEKLEIRSGKSSHRLITQPTTHNPQPASRFTHHASRFTFYVLLVWQVITTLGVYPYTLTFFNELAGGAHNGWRYLADSNTDWGQGYKALARFQDENKIATFNLSAFIFYDPAMYGIDYEPLTPLHGDTPAIFPARFAPPPSDYVISATPLDGIPLTDPEMYDWFRWRAPDAQIANTLHYYRVVPEEHAITWVAQCSTPTSPLDDAAIAEGFGSDNIRRVDFDCSQSWVIPDGGRTPGRYVLHGALLEDTLRARLHLAPPLVTDAFIARQIDSSTIIYRQRAYRSEPAFAIYAATSEASTAPQTSVWVAPAETPSGALQSQQQRATPIQLDGPLAFLGAKVNQDDTTLTVETWWRVTDEPPARPLSVMGHLLTDSGDVTGIADGLGVLPHTWQQGDVIIQRHTFPLTQEEARSAYVLRTGIYWLDDGTRWRIMADENADAIFVPLNKTAQN